MFRIRYTIGIGYDKENGRYVAFMESMSDHKRNKITGTKFAPVLATMVKRLRKKERHAQKFPLPEEERLIIIPPTPSIAPIIITPNGS
jgi:hypothetical protein